MSTQTADRQFHPVAEAWPLMTGPAFDELVADVKEKGVVVPVVLHRDGRIIDGRNRYRASREAGRDCPTTTYDGEDSGLVAYCVSLNNQRRHLSETQRAMVAAKLANIPHGGDRKSDDAINTSKDGLISQPEAAVLLKVSTASVQRAKRVVQHAVPELREMVERDEVTVAAASPLTQLPHEEQREIVKLGPAAVTKASKVAVRERVVNEAKSESQATGLVLRHGVRVQAVIDLVSKVHEMSRLPDYRFSQLEFRQLADALLLACERAFPNK